MGPILVSVVIFGIALYLFIVTNRKIANIKSDILANEAKQEMESLITEFNRTATRNIELLEDRIETLQNVMKKADRKLLNLDERIDRSNKPIVVEKMVRENIKEDVYSGSRMLRPSSGDNIKTVKEKKKETTKKKQPARSDSIVESISPTGKKIEKQPEKGIEINSKVETAKIEEPLSRSDLLKKYLQDGKSREELVKMGFMENEINLLSFLAKKN